MRSTVPNCGVDHPESQLCQCMQSGSTLSRVIRVGFTQRCSSQQITATVHGLLRFAWQVTVLHRAKHYREATLISTPLYQCVTAWHQIWPLSAQLASWSVFLFVDLALQTLMCFVLGTDHCLPEKWQSSGGRAGCHPSSCGLSSWEEAGRA
jgi:hypothetical protein